MNWLGIVVIAFLVYSIFNGLRRGFVRTVISMLSIVLSIILVSFISPYVGDYLQEKTSLYDSIQKSCKAQMEGTITDNEAMESQEQAGAINKLPIPQPIKEGLLKNNNAEGYSKLVVEGFSEYITAYLAQIIMNGIVFLISFILAVILIRVITYVLDRVARLPVLHTFNRLGGGIAGAVQGLLVVWVIFLAVTLLYNTAWGKELFQLIQKDTFLSFLNDNNVLLSIIQKYVG